MIRHSKCLLIIWSLAEQEAIHLRQRKIEPAHFFLGLLKIVEWQASALLKNPDPKLEAEIDRDIADLKVCLGEFVLETTYTRRFLRGILPSGENEDPPPNLQRSEASRSIFAAADDHARPRGGMVLPVHLLSSLLESPDHQILTALEKIHTDPVAFRQFVTAFINRTPTSQDFP